PRYTPQCLRDAGGFLQKFGVTTDKESFRRCYVSGGSRLRRPATVKWRAGAAARTRACSPVLGPRSCISPECRLRRRSILLSRRRRDMPLSFRPSRPACSAATAPRRKGPARRETAFRFRG